MTAAPPRAISAVAGAGAVTLDVVHHCDALTLLRALPSGSVDCIVTDPPYFGVKDEAWDNQWKNDADYLAWLGVLCDQWQRVLKPNGSLYCFASPRLAAHVEIEIGKRFNVLNRITWQKPAYSTKAEMFDKETMRGYFPASEAIIFAELRGSDKPYSEALIDGNNTYWSACETSKRAIFGDYMRSEFKRANVTNRQIAALFPSSTGGLTGCVSNWLLGYNCPTPEQYARMRTFLNAKGDEFLRTEYEELRTEYEELRRPFNVTEFDPYTDVWTFATVNTYPGKHVCEKPLDMMRHIVRASSRPDAIVLDCFAGSGATLNAARLEGRHYIGCDTDQHWATYARNRLREPFTPRIVASTDVSDLPLFEGLAS